MMRGDRACSCRIDIRRIDVVFLVGASWCDAGTLVCVVRPWLVCTHDEIQGKLPIAIVVLIVLLGGVLEEGFPHVLVWHALFS